jgi:hypothetical protein
VIDLLQERAPDVAWHPGRVAQLVADFPDVDVEDVAGECCDWIVHRSRGDVADGPAALRKFLRRRRDELQRDALQVVSIERQRKDDDLEQYDRFCA